MTWAPTAKQPGQKTGAWTKRKIRKKRAQIEAERGGQSQQRAERPERMTHRLPHEL